MLFANIQLYLMLWYIFRWALTMLWCVLGALTELQLGLRRPPASKETYQEV